MAGRCGGCGTAVALVAAALLFASPSSATLAIPSWTPDMFVEAVSKGKLACVLFYVPGTEYSESLADTLKRATDSFEWFHAAAMDVTEAGSRMIADIHGITKYPAVRIFNTSPKRQQVPKRLPVDAAIEYNSHADLLQQGHLGSYEALESLVLAMTPSRSTNPRTGYLQQLLRPVEDSESFLAGGGIDGSPANCVITRGTAPVANQTMAMLRALAKHFEHRLRFGLAEARESSAEYPTVTCQKDGSAQEVTTYNKMIELLTPHALSDEASKAWVAKQLEQRREDLAKEDSVRLSQITTTQEWNDNVRQDLNSIQMIFVLRRGDPSFASDFKVAESLATWGGGATTKKVPMSFYWIDTDTDKDAAEALGQRKVPSVSFTLPVTAKDQSGRETYTKATLPYRGKYDEQSLKKFIETTLMQGQGLQPIEDQKLSFSADGKSGKLVMGDEPEGEPLATTVTEVKYQQQKQQQHQKQQKKSPPPKKDKKKEEKKKPKKDKPMTKKEKEKLAKVTEEVNAKKAAREKRLQEKKEKERLEKEKRMKDKEERKKQKKASSSPKGAKAAKKDKPKDAKKGPKDDKKKDKKDKDKDKDKEEKERRKKERQQKQQEEQRVREAIEKLKREEQAKKRAAEQLRRKKLAEEKERKIAEQRQKEKEWEEEDGESIRIDDDL